MSRARSFLIISLGVAVLAGGVMALSGCAGTQGASVSTMLGAATTVIVVTTAPPTTVPPSATTTAEPTTTTTDAPTTTTLPADPGGWQRFSAGGISLALPASFKGGTPDSDDLTAAVGSADGGNAWVSGWRNYFKYYKEEWLLGFLEQTKKTTYAPLFVVARSQVPSSRTLSSYVSVRMALTAEPKGSKVEMISKSEAREAWVLTRPKSKSTFDDTLQWFFIRSGEYIYVVDYQCYTAGYPEFDSLFK